MREFAFGADGVEPLPHVGQSADDTDAVGFADLLLYDRGGGEEAHAVLSEHLQQRDIFRFAHDARVDVVRDTPRIERRAAVLVVGMMNGALQEVLIVQRIARWRGHAPNVPRTRPLAYVRVRSGRG
jgi:hypothetical protein